MELGRIGVARSRWRLVRFVVRRTARWRLRHEHIFRLALSFMAWRGGAAIGRSGPP